MCLSLQCVCVPLSVCLYLCLGSVLIGSPSARLEGTGVSAQEVARLGLASGAPRWPVSCQE